MSLEAKRGLAEPLVRRPPMCPWPLTIIEPESPFYENGPDFAVNGRIAHSKEV
jgi:hypothetical protein